MQLCQQYRR